MRILKVMFLFAVLMAYFPSTAGEPASTSVGPDLPPKILTLLIKEMGAIYVTTQDIFDAIIRGQDDVVASKAQAIHDSFIMKKEMTQEDKKQLMNSVPKEFIELDKEFHNISLQLANAARDRNKSLQIKLFNQMVSSCVKCHSNYATHRFPDFTKTK